ncbi:hypothetical protein Tco_0691301, partial [Tanacetum coccineum]
MEFESAQSNTTAKLPILKLGEYEMWVIRIKQYFQVQDYALWEVIENGNSWVSVPQTAQENGTSVTKMSVPVTAEEKTNKKNDVKARSLLLMALPNEHQLTFSQYTDAKTIASSTESLDSIFNRLQKIVSRLAILGVVITQEDLNSKFLTSLPPEWNTHVVVWMNKAEIETMSIDDFSGAQNLAFMTAPSTNNTNDVNTAKPAYKVSTVTPNVNTASPQVSSSSFSDNAVSNGFEVTALSAKYEGKESTKEQRGSVQNQDNTRKQGNNEDTSSKAMLAIDGVGFDWSDMAEEPLQTNMAMKLLRNKEQLITYRKNEVLFSEEVAVLKREVACKDYEINVLKSEFEKVKQEKEGIEFKIEKFDNASKSLNQLLESQITDKSKKGLGYNAVPPPHPLIYNRPKKLDLYYSGFDESKAYGSKDSKQDSNIAHCKYHQREKMVYGNNYNRVNYNYTTNRTHPNAQRNMVPRAVLMRTGLKPFNIARTVNTAHPKSIGKPLMDDKGFVDNGCSRHMTGNIAYL